MLNETPRSRRKAHLLPSRSQRKSTSTASGDSHLDLATLVKQGPVDRHRSTPDNVRVGVKSPPDEQHCGHCWPEVIERLHERGNILELTGALTTSDGGAETLGLSAMSDGVEMQMRNEPPLLGCLTQPAYMSQRQLWLTEIRQGRSSQSLDPTEPRGLDCSVRPPPAPSRER